ITPDLPGFGKSKLPPNPFSIDEIADQMLTWLHESGIKKSILIGHSLGGYVTLAMAKKKVEAFSGIGLFHSTAFADSDDKKANRDKTIEFVRKNGVAPFASTFVQGLFRDNERKHLTQVNKMASSTPLQTVISYTKAMRDRESSIEFLRTLPIYLLVIAGVHDSIIPVAVLKQVAELAPKGVFKSLEKSAHMGMMEDRLEALNAIVEFSSMCLTGQA
ncbi:MAG: alpha/beta hydrolase, partial [Cyclobacteriaceae bacterium]|nr:alpha/beta hydrolase [Cyclobacteriaceae bacterium]